MDATLKTADTMEGLENAEAIPVENVQIDVKKEEKPKAAARIIKMHGKWAVQLPTVIVTMKNRKVPLERFMSSDGGSVRLFHTKAMAESQRDYYNELLDKQQELLIIKREEERLKAEQGIEATIEFVPPGDAPKEQQEGWPIPEDYDPSKDTGKIFTGRGVDEDVAREAAAMAQHNEPTP